MKVITETLVEINNNFSSTLKDLELKPFKDKNLGLIFDKIADDLLFDK